MRDDDGHGNLKSDEETLSRSRYFLRSSIGKSKQRHIDRNFPVTFNRYLLHTTPIFKEIGNQDLHRSCTNSKMADPKQQKSSRPGRLLTLILLSHPTLDVRALGFLKLASRVVSPSSPTSPAAMHFDRLYTQKKSKRIQYALRRIISFRSTSRDDIDLGLLKSENSVLRDTIRQLEEENQKLKQKARRIVGLEQFEGERFFRDEMDTFGLDGGGLTLTGEEIIQDELWCDQLDEDECPLEPTISFGEALRDRAYWLVGLLLMQSFSGIILSRNEALLADHPAIIFFLTMLVGAGGNAGNQASVRVIRGLALGTLNDKTRGQFLSRELKMATALSIILSVAGFSRAIFFKTALPEALAVTTALSIIVFSSICLGAILPIFLEWIGVDPAHSSTTIQVIMDILGVILAVTISRSILDGPLGSFLVAKLTGAS